MQAVAIERGEARPRLVEVSAPTPRAGEALVRTLRVGVDGTDHEVIAGSHGTFPADDDYLVLGHEAVGVVADPNGTDLREGQVVVPTVRRPRAGGSTVWFDRGQPDMAPDGEYVERGIEGAHGFMTEYFTSPAEDLVPIPDDLAPYGFLVEPISITEKALELAYAARSSFDWQPESALVAGNGCLGLLTLAMLDGEVDRCYCLGRRDRPDPTIDLVEDLGATYVDSRATPLDTVPDAYEPMDLVYEATGYARHAFEAIDALAPNGVAALLGVPGDWSFEVDGGRLHRELVLGNRAMVGSVNSNRRHFEAAVETLAALPESFLDALVTGVYDFPAFDRAFDDDETTIKTAVQLSDYEER
jgi:threonine dehydrogenase-like Zn-dependent dehydrogenase